MLQHYHLQIFIIPCAVARNIGTLLICQLIDAFSAPMTCGSLADNWKGPERGAAMAMFSAAPFLGPVVGAVFVGLPGDNTSTWRWILDLPYRGWLVMRYLC